MTATESLSTNLTIILTGLSIITIIIGFVIWAKKRYFDPLRNMVEEWQGDPGNPEKGIAPRFGALVRITKLEEKTDQTHAAVTPNGGSSMADKVNQIANAINQSSSPTT